VKQAAGTHVYRSDPWSPTHKAGRLRPAVLDLLMEHQKVDTLPTNGRFIFYEMEQRGFVTKSEARDVTWALTWLREKGYVPWEWIRDETRQLHQWPNGATVLEDVHAYVERARIDPWQGMPPLILCESRSLAGVLDPLAYEYLALIAATNGQVGGFLHTDIAPVLKPGMHVLYLGDYDLSGHQIEDNTRAVVEREQPALVWERLLLTEEKLDTYDLRRLAIEKKDRRFKGERGRHMAVESETLSQRLIVDLVRARLDTLLPEPLDDVLERQAVQRGSVAALLGNTP
jgi:hypothetical protein